MIWQAASVRVGYKPQRAGYSTGGAPANISILRLKFNSTKYAMYVAMIHDLNEDSTNKETLAWPLN